MYFETIKSSKTNFCWHVQFIEKILLLQCLKKETATAKELDLRPLGKVIIFRDRQTDRTFLLYIDVCLVSVWAETEPPQTFARRWMLWRERHWEEFQYQDSPNSLASPPEIKTQMGKNFKSGKWRKSIFLR